MGNGEWYPKASGADLGLSISVIKANIHKYSVSAMRRVLKISRSTYYYKPVKKENTDILEQTIKNIFKDSRNNYGTRKIKIELSTNLLIWKYRKMRPVIFWIENLLGSIHIIIS